MRYVMLICNDEKAMLDADDESAMLAEYGKFSEEMGQRGVLQGGERLRPTTDATTVRVRDGEVLTSDGPFAETKEQIGGLFLTDLPDLDEAIRLSALVPAAEYGSMEIRPIVEH